MKEHKNYSAADIDRYYSGAMSAAERHQLEKAALDDPFLADALEGYVHTATPVADLEVLQRRLQQRLEKKERRSIFYMNQSWMKVAALFIVLAGGAWIIFSTNTANKNDVAVVTSTEEKAEKTVQDSSTDFNSIAPTSNPALVQQDAAANEQGLTTKTLASDKQGRQTTSGVGAVNSANPTASPAIADNTIVYKQNSREEKFDLQSSPVLRHDSLADALALKDEKTAAPPVSSNDSVTHMNIVLPRTEMLKEEVVVMNTKAKTKPLARNRMQVVVDTLEPAQGWQRFDDYIAENINPPDDLRSKKSNGVVELSFDVNKQGEPVNIVVTKSLCSRCDAEAIRLLKQGPKWKTNQAKGKITIRF